MVLLIIILLCILVCINGIKLYSEYESHFLRSKFKTDISEQNERLSASIDEYKKHINGVDTLLLFSNFGSVYLFQKPYDDIQMSAFIDGTELGCKYVEKRITIKTNLAHNDIKDDSLKNGLFDILAFDRENGRLSRNNSPYKIEKVRYEDGHLDITLLSKDNNCSNIILIKKSLEE